MMATRLLRSLRLQIGLLALSTLGCLLTACFHAPAPIPPPKPVPPVNAFVGSAACQECHPKEFALHRASRHALTLRPMRRPDLGALAPPTGPIPKTTYLLLRDGDAYRFAQSEDRQEFLPLDLAFGSGKTGMTYVSVRNGASLVEARMTYFPHLRTWEITPGQELERDAKTGMLHQGDFPRRCLLCHAVSLPTNTLLPQPSFFGVGCESCHGPGGLHVAAMRSGRGDNLYMEKMHTWGAARINELCGNCHSSAEQVVKMDSQADMTQRFQPYGLMRSDCYLRSQDSLSCLRCHDPHTNARTDTHFYDQVCLQCHAGQTARRPAIAGKPCPVNPARQCTRCHMPRRKVFADTSIPTAMADHFIRVVIAGGRLPKTSE
jgi:hypothetical protein